MNKFRKIYEAFTTQSIEVDVWRFLVFFVLSGILAYILGRIYIKYGRSLSNRKMFARNFVFITVTTMLIITIVKSSLALSLGLVGALSIVRFRAAIKEPEELTYLFLAIAIGLGFGAEQWKVTTVAFISVVLVVIIKNSFRSSIDEHNLCLTVGGGDLKNVGISRIVEVLNKNCSSVDMRRLDESADFIEASFLVEFKGFEYLNECKTELMKLDEKMKITFLDNKGIL